MAAPTYRGRSSANITGSTSATFTEPASSADGDLQFIIMESTDGTNSAGTPTTPSGWHKLFEQSYNVGSSTEPAVLTGTIFVRIRQSGDGNQLVDGVGNHISGRMLGIQTGTHGVSNPATDIVVGSPTDHGTSTSSLSTASITVTADSMVLWVIVLSDDANDTTNASGYTNSNLASITERWDNTTAQGAGGGAAVATATCAGTTTGAGTWNHDTAAASFSLYLGVPPVSGQSIAGVVLSVTPSLPVGLVDHAITGAVLTVTPALLAGEVNHSITGIVVSVVPSLPVGDVIATVDGVVLTVTPTLPAAALQVDVTLTGIVLSIVPTFPVADQLQTITGTALSVFPSYGGYPEGYTGYAGQPPGALSQPVNGLVLTITPTLPPGALDHSIFGVAFTITPSLPAAQVDQTITGVVLTITPMLPAGTLDVTGSVSGIVLSITPTLPTASVDIEITGAVLTTVPTLPAGRVDQGLIGVVLSEVPTLPAGSLVGGIIGMALVAAPALPAGTINLQIIGVVLTVTPGLPGGQFGFGLVGISLTITPTMPLGTILFATISEWVSQLSAVDHTHQVVTTDLVSSVSGPT